MQNSLFSSKKTEKYVFFCLILYYKFLAHNIALMSLPAYRVECLSSLYGSDNSMNWSITTDR